MGVLGDQDTGGHLPNIDTRSLFVIRFTGPIAQCLKRLETRKYEWGYHIAPYNKNLVESPPGYKPFGYGNGQYPRNTGIGKNDGFCFKSEIILDNPPQNT